MQCTYCEEPAAATDHIPPKCLFPSPRPQNTITVPACRRCNQEASKDDEYFRNSLVMRYDVAAEPDAQDAVAALLRSIRRPEAGKLTKAMAEGLQSVEVVSRAGILIGRVNVFSSDPRMESVPCRIVKGLFYHHFGEKLPPDFGVKAVVIEQLRFADPVTIETIKELIHPIVASSEPRSVGDTFAYWFCTMNEETNRSCWVLQFYNQALFMVFTAEASKLERLAKLA